MRFPSMRSSAFLSDCEAVNTLQRRWFRFVQDQADFSVSQSLVMLPASFKRCFILKAQTMNEQTALESAHQAMREDLAQVVDSVHVGGGFYELHAQALCDAVDAWIEHQPAAHREFAKDLAGKHLDYEPNRTGRWIYDSEENDIHFVRTPVPEARARMRRNFTT